MPNGITTDNVVALADITVALTAPNRTELFEAIFEKLSPLIVTIVPGRVCHEETDE